MKKILMKILVLSLSLAIIVCCMGVGYAAAIPSTDYQAWLLLLLPPTVTVQVAV